MEKILKMLFFELLYKDSEVSEIKSIDDLCKAVISTNKVVEIFAAMNDMNDEYYDTAKILKIADEAYQEVRGNE